MYVGTCQSRLGTSICGIALERQFEVTLGMSIFAHAQAGYRICALHDCVRTMLLGDRGRGGQHGWPFATYVLCGAKCINEC